MYLPPETSIPQAFADVKSHEAGEDPGRVGDPGGHLDPRSLSAPTADLYVNGHYWATVQIPTHSPLAALARALSAESYRQSSLLQDDMIMLDAAWTHVSLHLCTPIRIPGMPL